jgi:hypothetical protein
MSEALSAAGPAGRLCGLAKIARYCFAVEGESLSHCGMPLREESIRIGGRTPAEFANRYAQLPHSLVSQSWPLSRCRVERAGLSVPGAPTASN